MESIHPNDLMSLDTDSISYITLKNGNMILIDDSVPQKTKADNGKNIIGNFSSASNEVENPKKEIVLEISSASTLSFEGKIDINKYKSNFKICSEISKNTSFSFNSIKSNQKVNNFNPNIEKENLPNINNISTSNNNNQEKKDINNNKIELKNLLKYDNNNNNKSNESSETPRQSSKESEKQNTNMQANNNNNENEINFSKIDKEFNQSNINTNLSIPLMNISNNAQKRKSVNYSLNRRRSTIGGKGKKSRISVNAVCSLNIKAEEKYKINLISQFNGIVDKLNAERDEKPIYDLNNTGKEKSLKYYEYYKNRIQTNFNKNMSTLNHNYALDNNNNFNYNDGNSFKTLNKFYKRKSTDINGFNRNILANTNIRDILGNTPGKLSTNKIRNFRDKIYKYSELVFPSNQIVHI